MMMSTFSTGSSTSSTFPLMMVTTAGQTRAHATSPEDSRLPASPGGSGDTPGPGDPTGTALSSQGRAGGCVGASLKELCELKPHPVNLSFKIHSSRDISEAGTELDMNQVLGDVKILPLTGRTRTRRRQPLALGHGMGKAATPLPVTPHTLMGNLVPNHLQQIPRDSEGQGCLVCCSPWGCKELDVT